MENKNPQQINETPKKNLKAPNHYFGLKRLIEIGAIASPLVVVFAVFIAPLIAESVGALIEHNYIRNIDWSGTVPAPCNALLTFGITGLIVASVAIIFVGIQTYYYFTRQRRERHILYALGGFLLLVILASIITNSVMHNSAGFKLEILGTYTTLLQSMIAISIFVLFNIIFMYSWTRHLKNVGVPRVKDTDIMEDTAE